jgi:hypothetical protein
VRPVRFLRRPLQVFNVFNVFNVLNVLNVFNVFNVFNVLNVFNVFNVFNGTLTHPSVFSFLSPQQVACRGLFPRNLLVAVGCPSLCDECPPQVKQCSSFNVQLPLQQQLH